MYADELNDRALAELGRGRFTEATGLLADALAADPRHPAAAYNAGLLR